ncbi:MAG: universal stress protein [Planctomycetaceae bacterium]
MIRLQNILIPTDFSEPAMEATRHALELARPFRANVHLLYVIDEPSFQIHGFGGYIPGREEFEAFGDAGLTNWIAEEDEKGLNIIRAKEFGKTYKKIVDYAAEHDIDLVVMGTHGRSPITRGLLGSVAENVVRYAECPVLTVHPEGRSFVVSQDAASATNQSKSEV